MKAIICYEVAARISPTVEVKRKSFTDGEKALRCFHRLKHIFPAVIVYGLTDQYETEILMSTEKSVAAA